MLLARCEEQTPSRIRGTFFGGGRMVKLWISLLVSTEIRKSRFIFFH